MFCPNCRRWLQLVEEECPRCGYRFWAGGLLMNAREELEKVIIGWSYDEKTGKSNVYYLVQAILDAGFIRLEDVEIDEEKISEVIGKYSVKNAKYPITIKLNSACGKLEHLSHRVIMELVRAISQAKGILRVKEGK